MSEPILVTASGRKISVNRPCAAHIDLRDIAHHLAMLNRFNGATQVPYSVAQHSCLVAKIMLQLEATPLEALHGLLHDGHEAYLGDMTRPVKLAAFGDMAHVPSEWDCLVDNFDHAIWERFGLKQPGAELRADIAQADNCALATEWRDLMVGDAPFEFGPAPWVVKPINWAKAEEDFINTFEKLAAQARITI